MSKKVFLVTTEASGDLLGSGLVSELLKLSPELKVNGVGGDGLQALGMECTYHIRDFSVMGLFEVLSQLKALKAKFNHLVQQVKESKPDVVVLIDAPDFNIRCAKAIRPLGIPIIYYVSPQVWAWRKRRAAQITGLVDHMMVLFAFEAPIYQALGLPTTWVGHPLLDELQETSNRQDFLKQHGFLADRPLVALAPGSRNSEIKRILPVMADVARQRADDYQFAMPLASTVDPQLVQDMLQGTPVRLLPGLMRPLMRHANAAVVASGTATLETGLLHTPMIVGYRLKASSYWLARLMVRVPHIALVNIVLDKRVVPELVQADFNPHRVLGLLDELLTSPTRRQQMLDEFDRLSEILGGGGASGRAAQVIWSFLHS